MSVSPNESPEGAKHFRLVDSVDIVSNPHILRGAARRCCGEPPRMIRASMLRNPAILSGVILFNILMEEIK